MTTGALLPLPALPPPGVNLLPIGAHPRSFLLLLEQITAAYNKDVFCHGLEVG